VSWPVSTGLAVGGVQMVQLCTVPGRSRATVRCKVNCSETSELGVVEGALGAVQLANSLNRSTG